MTKTTENIGKDGAESRTRTGDLPITNRLSGSDSKALSFVSKDLTAHHCPSLPVVPSRLAQVWRNLIIVALFVLLFAVPTFAQDVVLPVTSTLPVITEQGCIEHSEAFKAAAREAWGSTGNGKQQHAEAGFLANRDGSISEVQKDVFEGTPNVAGTLTQVIGPKTLLELHTHPNEATQPPSEHDVQVAKVLKRIVMVQNLDGLDEVVPGTGEVIHVFDGSEWMNAVKDPHWVRHYNLKDLRASNHDGM